MYLVHVYIIKIANHYDLNVLSMSVMSFHTKKVSIGRWVDFV